MRFLALLSFSSKCFDLLAWPVLSLGYPLCASIRAIESESNENILNLVTYWVAFSMISLFDHTFAALLERIPLWPYVKLIAVCFLALPDFRGSFYAYEHIIHPCMLATVEFVTVQLHVPKDFLFQKDGFLAAAERYVAENGSESLEKLISEKTKKNTGLSVAAKDISLINTEKVVDSTCQFVQTSSHVVQKEVQTRELKQLTDMAAAECKQVNAMPVDKDGAKSTEGSSIMSEIPALKQVQEQKGWACALCQVTTSSELNMKAHYSGQRHRNKQAELKRMKQQQSKAKGGAVSSGKNSLPNATPKKQAAATEQKLTTGQKRDEGMKGMGANVQNPNNLKRHFNNVKPSQLWCSICDIKCCSEIDIACHLKGKKHLAKIEELKGSG